MTTAVPPQGPIGIIGIGAMGLAMARRLRDGGRDVVVRDIDTHREALATAVGCRVAASPAELAAGCALTIVVVVDGAQTDAVLFGAGGVATGLRPGTTVMLCPTMSPADTERAAASLATLGVEAIDAPMSGGPGRARDGSMSLMVACEDTTFDRWQPVLAWSASRLFRVGVRPGDGARVKLVNNLLAAVNLAGAAEALALASRLGLDPAMTLAVVEQSSGQSWVGSDRLRRALAVDHAPGAVAEYQVPPARMALLVKDSALALAQARQVGFEVPIGAGAAARFAGALAAGLAQHDDSSLWRWLLDGCPQAGPAASPPAGN